MATDSRGLVLQRRQSQGYAQSMNIGGLIGGSWPNYGLGTAVSSTSSGTVTVRYGYDDIYDEKPKGKPSGKASMHTKLCLETNDWLRETKEALLL